MRFKWQVVIFACSFVALPGDVWRSRCGVIGERPGPRGKIVARAARNIIITLKNRPMAISMEQQSALNSFRQLFAKHFLLFCQLISILTTIIFLNYEVIRLSCLFFFSKSLVTTLLP